MSRSGARSNGSATRSIIVFVDSTSSARFWRGLDVHDDAVLGVDQVVGRVRVERRPARRGRPAGLRISQRNVLGHDLASASASSACRYSRTARVLSAGSFQSTVSVLGTPRCRFASAATMLASTANPSPLTRPWAMQRRTTSSNSQRNVGLSLKRPCRFLEKVEWSGTLLPGPGGRTSDRPGSAVLPRTDAARNGCHSSSPR